MYGVYIFIVRCKGTHISKLLYANTSICSAAIVNHATDRSYYLEGTYSIYINNKIEKKNRRMQITTESGL